MTIWTERGSAPTTLWKQKWLYFGLDEDNFAYVLSGVRVVMSMKKQANNFYNLATADGSARLVVSPTNFYYVEV